MRAVTLRQMRLTRKMRGSAMAHALLMFAALRHADAMRATTRETLCASAAKRNSNGVPRDIQRANVMARSTHASAHASRHAETSILMRIETRPTPVAAAVEPTINSYADKMALFRNPTLTLTPRHQREKMPAEMRAQQHVDISSLRRARLMTICYRPLFIIRDEPSPMLFDGAFRAQPLSFDAVFRYEPPEHHVMLTRRTPSLPKI